MDVSATESEVTVSFANAEWAWHTATCICASSEAMRVKGSLEKQVIHPVKSTWYLQIKMDKYSLLRIKVAQVGAQSRRERAASVSTVLARGGLSAFIALYNAA